MQKKIIFIRGMHCRSCELLLEDAIGKVEDVKKVKVDFHKSQAIIEYSNIAPNENKIASVIKNAGYEVSQSKTIPWITEDESDLRNIIFSITLLIVLYYFLRNTGLFDISIQDAEVTTGFALLIGLVAGVSTCMALVGGLILGVSARHAELHPEASTWQKFRPHLFFNCGRILGYALLGGLLGLIGGALQISGGFLSFLTLAVGFIMIILGIKLTNLSPKISSLTPTLPSSIARFFGLAKHQREYSHRASFLTGVLTFFLPCGFTQAMQLYAVSTGDFKTGAIIMGAFALGTAPALLSIGGLSSIMKGAMARVFYAFVGILVIVFGAYNIKSALFVLPFFIASADEQNVDTNTGVNDQLEDVQVIKMTQLASGYSPKTLRVKAGVPVEWIITSESSYTCASSLVVPSLKIRKNLKKGENIIKFTPTKTGSIPFSCSMGMYRGTIIVE